MHTQIPGYDIDGEIGEGAMASVYLATQRSLERKVAQQAGCTTGAVTSNGSVSLNSFGIGNVSFANNSSVTGTLSASVAGSAAKRSRNATKPAARRASCFRYASVPSFHRTP